MNRTVLSFAALTLTAIAAPAFAAPTQAQIDAATKARCDKLPAAKAAKDAKCVAYAKAHPDAMQAGDAMMSDGGMESKKH